MQMECKVKLEISLNKLKQFSYLRSADEVQSNSAMGC